MAATPLLSFALLIAAQMIVAAPECGKQWTAVPLPAATGIKDVFNSYGWKLPQGGKFGRQTTYDAESGHLGWCGPNYKLFDDGKAVPVALDSSYMVDGQSPYQGVTGNCGRYLCVRIISNDRFCVPGQGAMDVAGKYSKGSKMTTFMGRAFDKCPECEKDHIDVARMRPYTNIVQQNDYRSVGIFWVDWAFVDNGNVNCDDFFATANAIGSAAQQAGGRRPGQRPAPKPASPKKPAGPKKPASPKKSTIKTCKAVAKKGQACGGLSGKKGMNTNSVWPGYCCAKGTRCQKMSKWYWQCK